MRTVKSGVTFGSALAMVISYANWHSVGWAIIHGLMSWGYVIYYVIKYQLNGQQGARSGYASAGTGHALQQIALAAIRRRRTAPALWTASIRMPESPWNRR